MPHTLTVTLSDPVYDALKRAADARTAEPADLAADAVARQYPPAAPAKRQPGIARRNFGAVSIGHPDGADNEKIDAALAAAYADNHEPD